MERNLGHHIYDLWNKRLKVAYIMKIGIDARCLCWQRGGVARILLNLLKLWPLMTDRHRYVLYYDNEVPDDDCLRHTIFEHRVIRGPRFLTKHPGVSEHLFLPFEIQRDKLDLFFATYYTAPMICPCPKIIVAAWDISYTTHPHHYSFRHSRQMSLFSRYSCRRASGVVTCSPFDGRQIERVYGVPKERICVLQLAADDKFKPLHNMQKVDLLKQKYSLPERYILSMGVIHNRRNVPVIIRAFNDIYEDYPDVGLVVVGHNFTTPRIDFEALMKPLIERGKGVYIPGHVPEDDMMCLYCGAWYYICTSTIDGEALMLKEAMRCGTPVITSPFLEETVGGNAVILKDPTSVKETSDVFRKVFTSYELRDQYAAKGLEWVQQLSWYKVAQETMQFFESR